MAKILINNTGSDIFLNDLGLNVPASSSFTVPAPMYLTVAQSSDIIAAIAGGGIVVNNGTVNLPVPDATALIQSTTAVNSRYVVQMGYSGVAIVGTYLQGSVGLPSSSNPFIIAEPCLLKAWSFSGSSIGTATYDVQVNGSTIFQVALSSAKSGSSYQLNYSLNIGDQIAIKCTAGTLLLAIGNPMINLFIETSN